MRYSNTTGVPDSDFISAISEALWKCFSKTGEDTPESHTRAAIRMAANRVLQSATGTYYRRVYATLDKPADEDTPRSEPADAETTEAAVFDRPNARKAHQLELIRSLVDKTDSPTMSLVEAYLDSANHDARRTQIAKSVGLHHKVADDKLRKLSRRYDANRFGDIHEYLAV
ncbi:hypothetical protein D3C75_988770 [compost metagenome]